MSITTQLTVLLSLSRGKTEIHTVHENLVLSNKLNYKSNYRLEILGKLTINARKISFPNFSEVVIQPLSTHLMKPNFHVSLSH